MLRKLGPRGEVGRLISERKIPAMVTKTGRQNQPMAERRGFSIQSLASSLVASLDNANGSGIEMVLAISLQ
jgi:hypothetical protein